MRYLSQMDRINNNGSFELQSQRLIDLFTENNWDQDKLIEIYTDQMDNSNGISQEDQVRQQLFGHWEKQQ